MLLLLDINDIIRCRRVDKFFCTHMSASLPIQRKLFLALSAPSRHSAGHPCRAGCFPIVYKPGREVPGEQEVEGCISFFSAKRLRSYGSLWERMFISPRPVNVLHFRSEEQSLRGYSSIERSVKRRREWTSKDALDGVKSMVKEQTRRLGKCSEAADGNMMV